MSNQITPEPSQVVSNQITPGSSQFVGVCVSVLTGFVVFLVVYSVVHATLDFWYLDQVVGPAVGAGLGLFSAFAMFTQRQFTIPLNWVGVGLLFNKPTGSIYENGTHWIVPFMGIRNVPANTEKFILKMPGEKFNAQDGNLVYFGISPEEPEKRNRIQYSVIDPVFYIAVDTPEDSLREAYLEKARLFFGQATMAIGVKNEQTLFSDYIILPPKKAAGSETKHRAFEARLKGARFTPRGGEESTDLLFTEGAVKIIMENAGEFLESAAGWGIGEIFAFTPSVRENPEMERADAERQAVVAEMSAARTRTARINRSARSFVKIGVAPDLAASLAAKLAGENIEVDNKTFTVSGLPEVLKSLGDRAIDAFSKSTQATLANKSTGSEGVT